MMNHPLNIQHARARFPASPRPREGFTLIELMIVVAILLAVTMASVPILNRSGENRAIREAARTVAEMLSTARARAVATGKPVGVWIDPMPDPVTGQKVGASQTLYFCEQQAPYTGDTPNAWVKVTQNAMGDAATSTTTPVAKIYFSPTIETTLKQLGMMANVANGIFQGGPYFIRIGGSGPYYRIENQKNGSATVGFIDVAGTGTPLKRTCNISNPALLPGSSALPLGTIATLPKPMNGSVVLVDSVPGLPYQITRVPIKTPDAPLQLPAPACIDITQSGMTLVGMSTTNTTTGLTVETTFTVPWTNLATTAWPVGTDAPSSVGIPQYPIVIWFGPNGGLENVYWSLPIIDPITKAITGANYYSTRPGEFVHLLIGRRDLVIPSANLSSDSLVDSNLGQPIRSTTSAPPEAAGTAGPAGSMWVTIGAKTGLVTVAENIDPTNKITAANSPNALTGASFQLGTARANARAEQATGGR